MADVATPSAITMSTIDAGSEPTQKAQKSKPEKPDEQHYQEILAKADKEHKAAQEKVVRSSELCRQIRTAFSRICKHQLIHGDIECHQSQDRSRPTSK